MSDSIFSLSLPRVGERGRDFVPGVFFSFCPFLFSGPFWLLIRRDRWRRRKLKSEPQPHIYNLPRYLPRASSIEITAAFLPVSSRLLGA